MNKLKALWNSLPKFWASLPHPVQAIIVAFLGGCSAELGKLGDAVVNAMLSGNWSAVCFSLACLKHDIALTIFAGLVAARAFYMLPNGKAQLVEAGKQFLKAQPSNTSSTH